MLELTARTLLGHLKILVRTRLEEKKLLSYRIVVSQIVYRGGVGVRFEIPPTEETE